MSLSCRGSCCPNPEAVSPDLSIIQWEMELSWLGKQGESSYREPGHKVRAWESGRCEQQGHIKANHQEGGSRWAWVCYQWLALLCLALLDVKYGSLSHVKAWEEGCCCLLFSYHYCSFLLALLHFRSTLVRSTGQGPITQLSYLYRWWSWESSVQRMN